jgi:hypothetical protein
MGLAEGVLTEALDKLNFNGHSHVYVISDAYHLLEQVSFRV